LEEAVRTIRGLWSESKFTFGGRLYETDRAQVEPKPDRPIPIWLGTFGNRALAVTGRVADGWIPSLDIAPPDRASLMRERIFAAARDAGRDPGVITCAYNLLVRVDHEADPRPSVASGSSDAVVERLLGFVKIGFTAMNFKPVGPDENEQAERLARERIPAVLAAA
jgi:alkanesulfonate monooxygenase SsuD/methylene tetrahydromethanopterin reductase-like flavin-dependent oxidoreductase (luciferase family)